MPDWTRHIRPRLSPLRLSPVRENEIVEELAQHLDDRWRELIASGKTEAEAARLALAEFRDGNLLAQAMAPLKQAHAPAPVTAGAPATSGVVSDLWQDLRYAWRMACRHPGFTSVAVLTLALGIGVNSAVFSLVDAVLLRALPVKQPDRLVVIEQNMVRGGVQNISHPLFEQLRADTGVFSGVLAAQDGLLTASTSLAPPPAATGGPGDAGGRVQRAAVQAVSGEYFDVLGVAALAGRTFTRDDDAAPGAHPVAVLSHAFWTRRLGADPAIVGRVITIERQPFTIVGVAQPGFFGVAVGRAPDIWVPMAMHPSISRGRSLLTDPRVGWLTVIGRLRPDVTRDQAEAALALQLDRLKSDPSSLDGMPRHMATLHAADGRQGQTRLREQFSLPLRILAAAVGIVLLIACANVATMQLARASTRRREIAIRLAIGASRRRLVRQLTTESFLLAAIGGVLGLLLSWWGSRLLLLMAGAGGAQIDIDVTPSARLVVFNVVVTIGVLVLTGIAPAWSASRPDVAGDLRQTRGGRARLSPILVVAQVALALPLIAGAALFMQTLDNLRNRDLGFAEDALLQVSTRPEESGYTRGQIPALARRIVDRLRATPGARAVSVASSGFATGTPRTCCIAIPDAAMDTIGDREVRTIGVGPEYFATVGQRLILGRDFTPRDLGADVDRQPRAAIVNEAFVRRFYGNQNPVGRMFGWGDPPKVKYEHEIVGVVNDAIYDEVRGVSRPLIYFPSEAGRLYVVRAAGMPADVASSLQREILAVDPKLIVTAIVPVAEDIERALVREKLLARLAGMFGAIACALAAIGLYGLMSYTVANRTRDIGIRMALGASHQRVLTAQVWSALRLAGIGIAIGIPAALASGRLLAAQLFGVSAGDPATLAAAAVLLSLTAAAAAYGPARRASRVDPLLALRNQ